MKSARPKVRPYVWANKDGTTRNGYQLMMGTGFVFIPEEKVYEAADALVDAHEQKEN